jgi:hypothetical protein
LPQRKRTIPASDQFGRYFDVPLCRVPPEAIAEKKAQKAQMNKGN